MQQTPRLAIPLITAGQSQKDVTHNDAVLALDRLVTLAVMSDAEDGPPESPADGAVWIVPVAGAAGWGQMAGTLMYWQDEAWIAQQPHEGQMAYVTTTGAVLIYAGSWRVMRSMTPPAVVTPPSGGSAPDPEARQTLATLISIMEQHGFVTQSP